MGIPDGDGGKADFAAGELVPQERRSKPVMRRALTATECSLPDFVAVRGHNLSVRESGHNLLACFLRRPRNTKSDPSEDLYTAASHEPSSYSNMSLMK